ncbi:TolC family protein [Flammeovirga yaeyamensis]|uniref:TolC family protein n=1 Tax=Flammeovirga yaeyamensis TaxID=367791 RepID=A0AAX1MYG6_9BACT|nr:TolC family protein [Flammeovirga yaeyamensis]MBB3696159.1 outer membrane protein TolC [Flammeovirga yaeyamensis]NMF34842.1 TolC family protein [Flammeovirga yaeyamensis]QWG00330.1 TolC family protein [Flammeovirga yaeyamensis]
MKSIIKKYIISILLLTAFQVNAQNQFLDSYIQTAIENNYGVQSQSQNIQAVAAEKEIIKGQGSGNLEVMYGYGVSPIETRNGPLNHKVSAGIMLPWFGTRSTKYQVVDQKVTLAQNQKKIAENNIRYSVRATYFKMIQNKKDLASARENLDILKSFENIALTQYENSKGSMVDVLRVQMEMEDANNKIESLMQDSLVLKQQLDLVINKPLSDVQLEEQFQFRSFDNAHLEENPTLQSLTASEQVVGAQMVTVNKAAAPQIKVSVDYGILGQASGMSAEDAGKNTVMPMVGLSIPLFNQKKYSGQKEQLRMQQQTISLKKQETENVLKSEYLKVQNQLNDAQRDIKVIQSQLGQIDQAIDIQQEAYTVAKPQGSEFLELLRLQIQRLNYQFKQHQAEQSQWEALAKLSFIEGVEE